MSNWDWQSWAIFLSFGGLIVCIWGLLWIAARRSIDIEKRLRDLEGSED